MARTVDTKSDLQALQNAMSQLSMLAASAPAFQAAIAAAREILSSMSEAEAELDRVVAERAAAVATLNGLNSDIESRRNVLADAEAAVALTLAKAAALDEEYRAAHKRFDDELEQYRANETRRIRRDLADAEEAAAAKKAALLDVVSQLEKRRTDAEEGIRALKEKL